MPLCQLRFVRFLVSNISAIIISTFQPRVFVRFGKTKGEIRVEKGNFRGDFEGVGPCLGISHPTHPHLGKISQKKRSFLDASPNADNSLIALISGAGCLGSGSAGVFMFWKFPEFVKCARRSRAHLTDSGNFQKIHIQEGV